ncbi:ORF MSV143 putative poly(A) polymerase large subunit PAP-L homolog (vaccinia E1L), similar to SW:P33809 [Melanoplus sanguinipes entomopoxvirus]|uniref:Poly(A) polymerase catalytic subunit n=1 Tax=Melanoplus sanguinipes entomopoxvirus TaxID=83191 RepID=Q9YVU9_MSEPV|nr:ORF MSV143 putative poly(A) polymerase large subunit PAP-L homolog (vaccinia E1L), similar to SW:P33809 [Melanoplus sanguinipes entomopoxvirus]AAC97789.1 ORF MSV143 putative poly(A) polymerase large subunit PAP-L homolog (vaccinia E1L), similar to SW:P33809 [Melanoplus sanguinipes entomopoxvirus 'O']
MNTYINTREFDNELIKYKQQIDTIVKFDKDEFIKKLIIIKDIYITDFINISKNNDIKRRVYTYFNKQNTFDKIGSIIAVLKFQHLIVTYVNRLLEDIIDHNNGSISVELMNFTSITSKTVKKSDESIAPILKVTSNYLCRSRLINKNQEIPKNKNVSDDVINICKLLENILKTILVIKNHECLVYGSFTCFNIDSNIKYNDIDLYSINAYKLMIFFMSIINFLIGYDVYIFSIPFIEGHISLKYKDVVLIDCIFLPKKIIDNIPKVMINNIYFIDPGMQTLNNFRMLSENFRSFKLTKDFENSYKKYIILIEYFIQNSMFNIKRLKEIFSNTYTKKSIPYTINNTSLTIDIKKFIPSSLYDYVIVIWNSPDHIMKFLSKIKGRFSMKYGSFLNEIFFETSISSDKISKMDIIAGNVVCEKSPYVIDENTMKKINVTNDEIDIYIDTTKKYLIFTNLTTSTYLYVENDKVVDISMKNLVSFIATISLYNFLHKNNEFAMDLYYYLFALLRIEDDRFIEEYTIFPRYKRKGEHIEISMYKNIFKSIFNASFTTNDVYMNYNTFIENTNIYGGF